MCRDVARWSRGGDGLLGDQRGTVVILFAVLLPVLLGIGALAVDAGHLYVVRTQLQTAADAAALAAVMELPNANAARAKAKSYAQKNAPGGGGKGELVKMDDVEVGFWDTELRTFTPNGGPANAIRVTVRQSAANGNPVPTFFAGLLGIRAVDLAAQSVVVAGSAPICILALDTGGKGIDMSNGTIAADGCVIHVNSNSSKDAIAGQANAEMSAAQICVVGNYQNAPTYSPTPQTGCPVLADPLAALPAPTVGACDYDGYKVSSGSETLNPGVYCKGLSITTSGTVTLNPGTYILKDGPFTVGGSAKVNGTGVAFYLTGGASKVKFSGGANLNLLAPTEGPLAGVLFFADRGQGGKTVHELVGGAGIHYEGTLYFPSTTVRFVGNGSSDAVAPYSMFIANKFEMAGIAEIHVAVHSNYYASEVPLPVGMNVSNTRLVQ